MVNPIKLVRVWWHLRSVPGGYAAGDVELVVEAFIKAGIMSEAEREDAVQVLLQQRIADGFERMARHVSK